MQDAGNSSGGGSGPRDWRFACGDIALHDGAVSSLVRSSNVFLRLQFNYILARPLQVFFSASLVSSTLPPFRFAFAAPEAVHDRSFYVNGWQSWSFTGTLTGTAQVPPYRLGALLNEGFHSGGRPPPILLSRKSGADFGNEDGYVAEPAGANGNGFRVSHWFGVAASPTSLSCGFSCKENDQEIRPMEGVVVGFVGQRRTLGTIACDAATRRLVAFADMDGVTLTPHPTDPLEKYAEHTEMDSGSGQSANPPPMQPSTGPPRMRAKLTTDWLSVELRLSLPPGEPMAPFLDFTSDAHGLPFSDARQNGAAATGRVRREEDEEVAERVTANYGAPSTLVPELDLSDFHTDRTAETQTARGNEDKFASADVGSPGGVLQLLPLGAPPPRLAVRWPLSGWCSW